MPLCVVVDELLLVYYIKYIHTYIHFSVYLICEWLDLYRVGIDLKLFH